MVEENGGQVGGVQYRLAWKFRGNGTTGTGPWMRNRETVEAWLESLSRRYNEKVEHWVETAPLEPWHSA